MPKEFSRSSRVAEQIQRDVAQMLLREIHDPRLENVSVTDVEVSRDLEHAKIFVTTYNPDIKPVDIESAFVQASGFIRRALAKSLRLRMMPTLKFIYDSTTEEGDKLLALIEKAKKRQEGS